VPKELKDMCKWLVCKLVMNFTAKNSIKLFVVKKSLSGIDMDPELDKMDVFLDSK